MFKLIMFIELCKISKLVMHLNSCFMDLALQYSPMHQVAIQPVVT